jgi:hypothetical protein
MKPTHLKTLSARIDELEHLLVKGKINGYEFINNLLEDKDMLKQNVTLSQFVPCKNGVPLEKPINYEKWLEYQEHGFELLFDNEAENQAYNEAQKSVIFEGWEVHSEGETVNKNGDRLSFFGSRVFYDVRMGDQEYQGKRLKDNSTLADLAEATTKNPLKLK